MRPHPLNDLLLSNTNAIPLPKDTALKHSYSCLAFLVINVVQISTVERQRT